MQLITFKSVQILSGGDLFFCDSSFVRSQAIIFLEKDLRNIQFYRKKEASRQLKSKHSSMDKSKYLIY